MLRQSRELPRAIYNQNINGIDSPADVFIGIMDQPGDAAVVVFCVNEWIKDPNHRHFYIPKTSPAGPWLECPCGAVKQLQQGQDIVWGPEEEETPT